MPKYIQEMQNQYSCGHEQRDKRPYFVVYESDDYVLAFPLTTKNKQTKSYPSHTNPSISIDKLDGEVMIDQLQLIYKKYFTNLPKTILPDDDYQGVIDSFITQIIKANENPNKDEPNCPSFCDIIKFTHNIPLFLGIEKWLVVSSKHFNTYSKMCFIVPYNETDLDFAYLHSIDWQARDISILSNMPYNPQDIQTLQQVIKQQFS